METTYQVRIPEWTLGDRLRKARESAGLEQTELASDIGISRRTVQNYERAKVRTRRPVLLAWAVRCGVPVEWLVNGTTAPPATPWHAAGGVSTSPLWAGPDPGSRHGQHA